MTSVPSWSWLCSGGAWAHGARLPDRPVTTPTVEVRGVLNKHVTQMLLIQDQ